MHELNAEIFLIDGEPHLIYACACGWRDRQVFNMEWVRRTIPENDDEKAYAKLIDMALDAAKFEHMFPEHEAAA